MPAEIEACVNALASKADNPHALCNWMRAEGKGYFAAGETPNIDTVIQEYQDAPRVEPPVIAVKMSPGHEDDESLLLRTDIPALGWIKRVYREGTKLYADADQVPDVFANLVKSGAYRKISAEIYTDFEVRGRKYGNVLRRVGVLGGEVPQVKTLKDIPTPANGQIKGMEIFDADEHREKLWTPEDLDQVVRNFDRLSQGKKTDSFAEATYGRSLFFHEAKQPMTTKRPTRKELKEKIAKFSDKAKETFAKFAAGDAPPMAPPPTGVDRAAMLEMLGQIGFDASTITDATPDNVLAEIIRVYKGMMAADAAEPGEPPQPGTQHSDLPAIAPPPAPAPVPAPPAPASSIPGVTGQPTQVTLKFGEKDVDLNQVLTPIVNAAVAAATKPIQDKLSAAEQSVSKFQEAEKKKSIDSRLDLLLKQGKVLPAEIDAGLKDQLCRADAIQKFSDGQTELDKQLNILEKRPVILKMSEQVKGGKGGVGNADDEAKKVQRFAEEDPSIGRALQATGKTSADYLAGFAAAKAKNPSLTAKQYGVPDAYLN